MKKKKIGALFLATALALGGLGVLASCEDTPDPTPVTPDPETLTISAVSLSVEQGKTVELSATSSRGNAISYSVDNANVSLSTTQTASGGKVTITGATIGSTKVTVTTSDGQTATCTVDVTPPKYYTFHEFLSVSPSNWNELTYQDNNDTEIMGYIGSNFFQFNYQYDEKGEIIDGGFVVEYGAAKNLEDVTSDYAGNPKYAVPEDAEQGYAYKITLRNDLKWDDGTPIKAKDFVYTMKQQEDPLFQNYRADSYYNGGTVIHNAQNYVKQGQSNIFASKNVYGGVYDEANDDTLVFKSYPTDSYEEETGYKVGENIYFIDWFLGDYASYKSYVDSYGMGMILYLYGVVDSMSEAKEYSDALDGHTFAEIKADATLNAYWETIIGWWQTDPGEELDFFVTQYTYPAVDFDDVGIFVGDNEYEIVLVLDKTLNLLKEDGSLSYKAAYNMNSLPLVKEDLYEANKVEPQIEGGLWTSKYNSSVETTASWGPYKLTSFQAGKQFILERNENWFGYALPEYQGQYQTDRIVCDIITKYETSLLMFEQGDLSSIGIDSSVAETYKYSERAVFTGDDYIGSLQLQSSAESLKGREEEGIDKEMLCYQDFRKAISLAIDRADYTAKVTTASLPGFGIFNMYHYYDVANAGVYRNEDVAKQVICDIYGVDVSEYDSLDAAYDAVTGYNPTLAKQLLTSAYEEALAAGTISETDNVVLTVGTSADTDSTRRQFNYLKNAFETLAVGTPLEGRLTLEFDASFGTSWANDFRDGAYDICTGGWSGAAWDPGYFLLAYLDSSYRYAKGWDTTQVYLTYNPYNDGDDSHEYTMNLMEWYNCLNGASSAAYNWAEGEVDTSFRLGIIAQLEKEILKVYYTIPLYNYFSASLRSYQIEYGSNNYNTFLGYGGIRYIKYNYTDYEWETVKGSFNYKN